MQRKIYRKEIQRKAGKKMRGRGGTPAFKLSMENRLFDLSDG